MSSHCFTVVQCTWVQTMQVSRKTEKTQQEMLVMSHLIIVHLITKLTGNKTG